MNIWKDLQIQVLGLLKDYGEVNMVNNFLVRVAFIGDPVLTY